MGDISTWSLIASQNGTLGSPPDYWPEGQAPSTVNDCAREMMRAIKKQFLDAAWVNAGDSITYISATKFSVSSSTSTAVGYYAVGRRVRLNDASTLYGTVTEASISATTTNVTVVLDSGSLAASLSAVAFSVVTPSNTPFPASTSIIYAADAGANDTYVITPSPALGSYTTGLMLNFKPNTVNTGAATLNVSALGAKTIVKPYGQTLEDGDIAAGQICTVVYDGTNFVLQSLSQRVLYQNGQQIYAADAQANDTYVITLSPAITAYVAGQMFHFKANTLNTGASTLNVNGLGAKTIKKQFNQDTATGDILAGQIVTVVYDGTNFQMLSSAASVTGGGWVKISSASASTSASIAFTGLSSTYLQYKVELNGVTPDTNGVNFSAVFGTGAGPTYQTSAYYWSNSGYFEGVGTGTDAGTNDASILLMNHGVQLGTAAGNFYNGSVVLYNPSQSATYQSLFFDAVYLSTGSAHCPITGQGTWAASTAVTAIKFAMSSGNILAGTFTLYGLTG